MIPAVLELHSKVRYGLTSRGVPLFRAIPYDSALPPFIAGCSERKVFTPIVGLFRVDDWNTPYQPGGSYPRGNLVQILGNAGDPQVEIAALLYQYAYSAFPTKPVQPLPPLELFSLQPDEIARPPSILTGTTFNIDPKGCRDVDDVFTVFSPIATGSSQWGISISITDVAKYVHQDTPCDKFARTLGTSFYSPTGDILLSMLPEELSINKLSLLPNRTRPVITLNCTWDREKKEWVGKPSWTLSHVRVSRAYTYEEADAVLKAGSTPSLSVLAEATGAGLDSHVLVERLMLLYNTEAGKLLKSAGLGILRQQDPAETSLLQQLTEIGAPPLLAQKAAAYVEPTAATTSHAALGVEAYAHASSPLRRYVDLYNQRCIRQVLHQESPMGVFQPPPPPTLIEQQNARSRAAKRFTRDLFAFTVLSHLPNSSDPPVFLEAICLEVGAATSPEHQKKSTFYVPAWRQTIRASTPFTPARGARLQFDWYADPSQARWKKKLVFRFLPPVSLPQPDQAPPQPDQTPL